MTAHFCEYGEMKLGQLVLEVVAPMEQPKERWGHVWTAEIVPELAESGRRNVERLGYADRVTYLEADASDGLECLGPFDLIIVTSAAPEVPLGLVNQVKVGGILLIPVGGAQFGQELIRISKNVDGGLSRENLGGVVFVPMKGKRGWKI